MYQSLYRKYRPKTFDEVVGQEIIIKTLKNTILNDRLSHAYLFTGPRGTGKTSVAKIFAKTINCENPQNAIPCEKCNSCTEINLKQTVDIVEIDAASNNGVDEIRELRNKATLVPSVGKYKVYIIDEVHMLTTGAFNALLKTLEEPPAHIIFILATTEPHKIPQTILSRCQRFDFKKIPQEKMIERLKYISNVENIDVDDKVYVEISKLSSGCMRDALSILDQVIAYSDKKVTLDDIHDINGTLSIEKLSDFVTSIVYHEYKTVFEMIDLYDKQGKNFIKLTEDMLYFFRNVMLYENVPDYEFEENVENYKKIVQNSNSFDCLKFIKTINEFLTDMKKTSNQQIVFEIMIISLLHIDELKQKKCISDENENMSKTVVEKTSRFEKSKNEIESSTPIQHEVLEEKPSNKEKQPINELDVKLIEKLKKLENIRVNNTLCNFNKKEFLEYKTRIDEIRNLIINPDYSSLVSLIIDGELKAYGNGNFIFLYKSERMKNSFNVNIIKIDELLTETFKINCKAIAISNDEWNVIKEEFNSKKKQYVYIDEPEDLENYLKTVHEDTLPIENLFGEIIEYN